MNDTSILAITHIVQTPGICGGVPRIAGTRITIDWIVGQMIYAGRTLDEMVAEYAHIPLTPAQLHAALSYFYDHQVEVDNLIEESKTQLAEVRRQSGPAI